MKGFMSTFFCLILISQRAIGEIIQIILFGFVQKEDCISDEKEKLDKCFLEFYTKVNQNRETLHH